MFNNKKQKNINNSGFTLVEMLVAISIFSMSIVALMSVLAGGIADTNYAKNKIIASFLAEDGVEHVRNMRDTYVLYDATPSQGWTDFMAKTQPQCADLVIGCGYLDSLSSFDFATLQGSTPFSACNISAGACILYYDDISGKYSYSHLQGTSSGFTRMITISVVSATEIKVTSKVSWFKNAIPYNVSFSDNLLKWKE